MLTFILLPVNNPWTCRTVCGSWLCRLAVFGVGFRGFSSIHRDHRSSAPRGKARRTIQPRPPVDAWSFGRIFRIQLF